MASNDEFCCFLSCSSLNKPLKNKEASLAVIRDAMHGADSDELCCFARYTVDIDLKRLNYLYESKVLYIG